MSDEDRLRSALTALAEDEPIQPVAVDLAAFDRARRDRRVGRAVGAAVIIAGAATVVVQAGLLDLGDSEEGPGVVAVQPGDDELPRVATIRCTENGTLVEPHRIAASADGVHVNVANETADGGTYVNDGQGGDPAPREPTDRVMTIPPGQHEWHCSHDSSAVEDDPVAVVVVDPDDFYEEVDAAAFLGCAYTGWVDGPTASGATGREAAEAWVAAYVPDGRLTPDSGYRDDPARDFLVRAEFDQGQLQIFPDGETGFTAGMSAVC